MKTLGAIFLVVISEIMADPEPRILLPSAEYIELHNLSGVSVPLNGYRLRVGKTVKALPPATLPPQGYLVLCDANDTALFPDSVHTAGIPGMPALVNTGSVLTLLSPEGGVVHTVAYSDRWYGSSSSDGGRSLEMIDPANPCGRSENWTASEDPSGGTPGRGNSVYRLNPDRTSPALQYATTGTPGVVTLHFSEPMDSASLSDPATYYGNKGLLNPVAVHPRGPDYVSADLFFRAGLAAGTLYTVTTLPVPTDCAGNLLAEGPGAGVALAVPADSGDVVFNEVLPDVAEGKEEFIELLNRSPDVADLSEFTLTLTSAASGKVTREFHTGIPYLLFPGKPVALTRDYNRLAASVPHPNPAGILDLPALFILPDEEGILTLYNRQGRCMDLLHYSQSMHAAFLAHTEGVSLERADPDLPTSDPENWHSAASAAGYATPGSENSQTAGLNAAAGATVTVAPGVFSPDGDGTDDAVQIGIIGETSCCVATVQVFDSRGTSQCIPVDRALLGPENWFEWDGRRHDGSPSPPGNYIIVTEITCPSGSVIKSRKVVALVRKL